MSRNAWLVSFAFLVNMMGTTLPTPLYPIYERAFGFDSLTITLIFSTYAFGVVAALLLFGRASDAVGRKPVLVVGLALALMSAAAFFFADGLLPILLARVFSGVSAGIFTGTASAYLIELVPEEQRSLGAGIAVAANIGGLGLGTLFSGILAQYAPLPTHTVFAVDAILTLIAILALLSAPETVANTSRFQWQSPTLHVPSSVRAVFVQAALGGICSFSVAGLLSSVAPSFLSRVLDIPNHAVAGLPIFAMMGTSAFGQMLLPRLNSKYALRTATMLLLGGVIVLTIAIAMRSWQLFFIAAIIEGLGQGIGIGSGLAAINQRITTHRGEVSSTYFVFLYLGLAIPVIGLGLLANHIGLVGASLAFSALIGLTLATVLALQLRPDRELSSS